MRIFKRLGQQLELFQKMLNHTNVTLEEKALSIDANNLRSGMFTCISCKNSEACMKFFANEPEQGAAPGFCPNSTSLNLLIRQN